MSHAKVVEGHWLVHTKILVKQVPENVLAMPISFLLNEYWLNHVLI